VWEKFLNQYPPQPPQYPPQLPPPGGYNPYNPYGGYDPNIDYVPWMPGRQAPRYLPIAIIVGAVLLCSFCSFCFGVIVGIELPAIIAPSSSQENTDSGSGDQQEDAPTPEGGFMWRVVIANG
jgi:hypothetical protein